MAVGDDEKLSYDSRQGTFYNQDAKILTKQVEGLKETLLQKDYGLRDLLLERDRRYEDRFKAQEVAVTTALASLKESTFQSYSSSEKAILKAEDAQRAYNMVHNDLVRKMDDQYKFMMPRTECEKALSANEVRLNELKDAVNQIRLELMKEITGLRESRSGADGRGIGLSSGWTYLLGAMVIIATILSLISFIKGPAS